MTHSRVSYKQDRVGEEKMRLYVSNCNSGDIISSPSLNLVVSKPPCLQPPLCRLRRNNTGIGYLLEDCASALDLCPLIKGHSSSAASEHNMTAELAVQRALNVPRKQTSR